MPQEPYDMTWKEPTPAQLAALKYVFACLGRKLPIEDGASLHRAAVMDANCKAAAVDADQSYSLSEFDMAEVMLLSQDSLWFVHAQGWADGQTPVNDHPPLKDLFQKAGQAICDIVRLGYQDGVWWDTAKLWPDTKERAPKLYAIVAVSFLLHKVRGQVSEIISAAFEFLPGLLVPRLDVTTAFRMMERKQTELLLMEIRALIDKDWAKTYHAAKRKVKAEVHNTYTPAKCIQPDCDHQVAPPGIKPRDGHSKNYRGSGACCKNHMSYVCTKAECVFHAKQGGYSEARHAWGSKVGNKHLEWRLKDG